jgi:pimeloyl-ACP methyl ester carboxylesterase
MLPTADAGRVEVWRLPAAAPEGERKRVALFAHGNGGVVDNFFSYQRWFSSLGITSYSLEYRGYGTSSGWPSDAGIRSDFARLWEYVAERDRALPADVVVMGVSLGTGPAAYLASRIQPRALILVAPYTSIPDVVRDRGWLGLLAPLVWTRFPIRDYLAQIRNTCIIALHGEQDTVIRSHHTRRLEQLYSATANFRAIYHSSAGHNEIFDLERVALERELASCLRMASRNVTDVAEDSLS